MNAVSLDIKRSREAPRSGTFIKAQLELLGAPTRDVVIRNLSETGALIEGRDLATRGEVTLIRNTMRAPARVIRFEGRQRGLHFKHPIQLSDWLPHLSLSSLVEAAEEARPVEDAFGSRKNDVPPPCDDIPYGQRVSEELAMIERKIGLVLDDLSDDALTLMRHPRNISSLETMQQLLGQLAKVLVAPDPHASAARISQEDVRRRILR